jgi:hypothetical protein
MILESVFSVEYMATPWRRICFVMEWERMNHKILNVQISSHSDVDDKCFEIFYERDRQGSLQIESQA